jgi:hypothetical protein
MTRAAPIRARGFVVAAIVTILGLLPSCLDTHTWVEKEKPWDQSTIASTDQVRVKCSEGSKVVLEAPRIEHAARGEFLVGREAQLHHQELRIDLASIRSLEVRETDPGRVTAGILAGAILVGAVLLYLFGPFMPSA